MNKDEKVVLLAKFFAKHYQEGDVHLDRIFDLQDQWESVYRDNRTKGSFEQARLLANEMVINKVLSDDYV